MYEDSVNCFDPNAVKVVQGTAATTVAAEDCFSQIISESEATTMTHTAVTTENNVGLSMETLSPYPSLLSYSCGEQQQDAMISTATTTTTATAMELGYHHPYNNFTHLVEEGLNDNNNNYDGSSSHDLSFDQSYKGHHHDMQFPNYPKPTPDLLDFLHLSPASSLANSSISFENPKIPSECGSGTWVGNCSMGALDTTNLMSSLSYNPFLHLNNLPSAAPGPLFQSLSNGFVFGRGDEIEGGHNNAPYQEGDGRDFENNGVIEFTQDDGGYAGKKRGGGKSSNNKQFTSTAERQRRVDLGGKFDALKELIPNPSKEPLLYNDNVHKLLTTFHFVLVCFHGTTKTKSDRASVVGDAIDYIKELLRTVNELKVLVEKKRFEKQRMKRLKVEEGSATEGSLDPDNHSYNESLRSSWIQRKSKDTEIDVRIIDNEVTIKLVQRKKINCLVYASQVLDDLKLDLQHVAGGHIGDFSSFMFNSKICEGSSVYASAIANKLIEVMDRSLAAA
ncbi:hypothetical protein RIF29_33297 [Crotalaria pallida]|uniref:BHLH domain-containing protein n=1 Tax=Crotalaria pallida TaxID=3830 RepID=A0AAN9HQM3_CROPI